MTKFKKGDVVTPTPVNGKVHMWLVRGNKYVVKSCYAEGLIDIDGELNKPGHGLCWSTDWFELAEERVTTSTAESLKELVFSIRQEREQTSLKLKDLDTQEAEAISQLNALGFSLFEEGKTGRHPSKTVLYAEDIEEDMTDPKNWKVGDVLEQYEYNFKPTLTPITKIEDRKCWVKDDEDRWWTKNSDGGASYGSYKSMKSFFKFHSRPVK